MITVGIDEVGRGSWAGPVVAGAVVLAMPIAGLKDSKKLTKSQREALALEINMHAGAVGIGWVEAPEVDRIGLTAAVGLAMQRALEQISVSFDEVVIDGNLNYFPDDSRAKAVIKADDSVPAVSAASIVAKVARDSYMANVAHQKYPEYAFDKHVGYGTSLHQQMLKLYGVTELHRKSFRPVQAIMADSL
ncbi:MAG: ribonuclease HII [Candidatus Saccharimonadales bacterium]